MGSDLSDLGLLVIQIDGIHMDEDMTLVAAIGVDVNGDKHPLGLVEGATENAATVQALIDNLVERGLDPAVPRLLSHRRLEGSFQGDPGDVWTRRGHSALCGIPAPSPNSLARWRFGLVRNAQPGQRQAQIDGYLGNAGEGCNHASTLWRRAGRFRPASSPSRPILALSSARRGADWRALRWA